MHACVQEVVMAQPGEPKSAWQHVRRCARYCQVHADALPLPIYLHYVYLFATIPLPLFSFACPVSASPTSSLILSPLFPPLSPSLRASWTSSCVSVRQPSSPLQLTAAPARSLTPFGARGGNAGSHRSSPRADIRSLSHSVAPSLGHSVTRLLSLSVTQSRLLSSSVDWRSSAE